MLSPGTYTLAAQAITVALGNSAETPITGLDGMVGANIVATLLGGDGGTSVVGIVQTSFDAGVTWLDIARFDFNTADSPPGIGTKSCVLQIKESQGITPYAALAVEGVNEGLLSDRLRAVLTTVGTYIDTTLSIRASVN